MTTDPLWLAAHYAFPGTYSCRIPLSSMSSVLAAPGPGPGTIRLALIRAGCEVYGPQFVREELYPIIRAAPIRVRPPERVAFSQQRLRGYKARQDDAKGPVRLVESLLCREVAQAEGMLMVYMQVPLATAHNFHELLLAIGYWGQADSLAMCWKVEEAAPDLNECLLPLRSLPRKSLLGAFFTCVLTDFRSPNLTWEDIAPGGQAGEGEPLHLELYVWPMIQVEWSAASRLFVRRPFTGVLTQIKEEMKSGGTS